MLFSDFWVGFDKTLEWYSDFSFIWVLLCSLIFFRFIIRIFTSLIRLVLLIFILLLVLFFGQLLQTIKLRMQLVDGLAWEQIIVRERLNLIIFHAFSILIILFYFDFFKSWVSWTQLLLWSHWLKPLLFNGILYADLLILSSQIIDCSQKRCVPSIVVPFKHHLTFCPIIIPDFSSQVMVVFYLGQEKVWRWLSEATLVCRRYMLVFTSCLGRFKLHSRFRPLLNCLRFIISWRIRDWHYAPI